MAPAKVLLVYARHFKNFKVQLPWGDSDETECVSGDPHVWDGRPVHTTYEQLSALGRDAEGYPLQGIDEVPNKVSEHCLPTAE